MVNYITEGELKASLRKLEPRPWKPDLPWHRSYAEDATPLTPGQVEEIVIDLEPTSNVFLKGHSLRVSIAGWDDSNFGGPQFDPPPTLRMYRDSVQASYIELPVIGQVAQLPLPPSAPAVVALPSTGSGPEDGGFQWTLVAWLLVGSAGQWRWSEGCASGSPGARGAAAVDELAARDRERRQVSGGPPPLRRGRVEPEARGPPPRAAGLL